MKKITKSNGIGVRPRERPLIEWMDSVKRVIYSTISTDCADAHWPFHTSQITHATLSSLSSFSWAWDWSSVQFQVHFFFTGVGKRMGFPAQTSATIIIGAQKTVFTVVLLSIWATNLFLTQGRIVKNNSTGCFINWNYTILTYYTGWEIIVMDAS